MKSRLQRNAAILVCLALAGAAAAEPLPTGIFEDLPMLKAGRSMRSSSCDPDWHNGNGDARPIPPGASLIIADLEGPGVIRHIWNTIAANELGYSRLLVLRMYWDGEEYPSVECPIGDFFAVGHGLDYPCTSQPVRVSSDGRARNCYWPMPFRKSARITVTNEGRERINAFYYYVDWQQLPKLPRKTAYFHAAYRQAFPTASASNYLIADIRGRGHYVGTVLSVRQHQASWWGEGDDFFYIDGEEEPSLRGTGSEDYFCDAWGLREIDGPYYGVTVFEGYGELSQTTCYRWHIPDPVTFSESLRVEIEHKGVGHDANGEVISGFEERADDFSSVAFWYQLEPHQPFEPLPPAYNRLYFDPATIQEAEGLIPEAKVSEGALHKQEGAWSGGAQLFWQAEQPNQTLTMPFEVRAAGGHTLLLLATHSWDYGTFQFAVDGVDTGRPVDLYSQSIVVRQTALRLPDLAPGRHTLTVRNVGKNGASDGCYFGLDGIVLVKE
ncbi:MAG: DUF2961 domain-containing protein [Candidatus Hydrogenedentes bacterium]|nr:DUF2961 domain-containing protein [Candidatus Hydrogenedentota bacterium]